MTSKETTPGSNNVPPIPEPPKDFLKNSPFVRGEEQDTAWSDLMSDMRDIQAAEDAKEDNPGFLGWAGERISGLASRVGELGGTALSAIGARVKDLRSNSDNSRRIDLPTPNPDAGRDSVEDGQDRVSTSAPESQSGDSGGDNENDKPVDGGEQDESGVKEDYQQEDSPEARLIKRRRESVKKARQRRDAITDDKSLEYQLADRDVEAAEIQLQAVEDQFGSSEQIKEESGADGKHDDAGDKGDETSESEDDENDKKSPEAPTPEDAARRARIEDLETILNNPDASVSQKYIAALERKKLLGELDGDKEGDDDTKEKTPDNETPEDKARREALEKELSAARSRYAEIRAEYEQTGMFKKLLKGKELKKRMELARAELEGYMTQLVYHQKDQERSIIKNGVEGANKEEQEEARQKAIQSIAAAVLEQHALVDEKTQEAYDKRLDERSLFKKVAAKIGRWFVGEENKDGGKLGLGGWLRSGGTGLAAGVTLGIFGVSFPISSVVGSVSSAGVKVAAHQRALENARGDKRELSDEGIASFGSAAQSLEWTAEEKDGSGRKDQSKEAVASMVGAALAETQKDTEKRQKNMTALGSKAAMGWGLGFAAGRITTELIKSHMIPDQKPANAADPGNGGDGGGNPGDPGSGGSESTQPGDVTEAPEVTATPPSEISLGSDGWVWDRVADVLGTEKAMPFLEQLAQTNPDFQLIDLPDGITGIAYQGNTDPQVVADAIRRLASGELEKWMLAA